MKAVQVKWKDKIEEKIHSGILVNDRYLICGHCGWIFDLADEFTKSKSPILKQYEDWVNLDEEITGEEAQ